MKFILIITVIIWQLLQLRAVNKNKSCIVVMDKNNVQISAGLLTEKCDRDFFIIASLSSSAPVVWKVYHLHSKLYRRYSLTPVFAIHFEQSRKKELFWSLLLLLSGDVEENPGPTSEDGSGDSSTSEVNDDAVKACAFYGSEFRNCGIERLPKMTTCLSDMMIPVEHVAMMMLPEGMTERDLIYNRMQREHSEVKVDSETQLCPEHRYFLGNGWHKEKRGGKGKFRNCMWKENHSSAANYMFTYQLAHECEVSMNRRDIPVGTPLCNRCHNDLRREHKEEGTKRQQIYEQERELANKIFAPKPQVATTLPVAAGDGDRRAKIIAAQNIQRTFASPGSAGSGGSLFSRIVHQQQSSQGYKLSQPGDRLRILNQAMSAISDLSGQRWNDLSFSLDTNMAQSSERTLRLITKAASEACVAVCNAIAPEQGEELFSRAYHQCLHNEPTRYSDPILKQHVTAIESVSTTNERIVVLSIICDEYSTKALRAMSPLITDDLIKRARKHRSKFGVGVAVSKIKQTRQKLPLNKVEHFFNWLMEKGFLQFTASGTLSMQFSSGERTEFGKIVLKTCRSQLISLYLQDCQHLSLPPELSPPLSERSLFRVFKNIKFTQKQAMAGLDNTTGDGLDGFETLQHILKKLSEHGVSGARIEMLEKALAGAKTYLQGQFMLNVAPESSSCAHHCRQNALSDPNCRSFQTVCDHDHNDVCQSCNLFFDVLEEIESELITARNLESTAREELEHDFNIAKKAVIEFRSHIIRGVHQDQARRMVLNKINDTSGFLIFDYAMKFEPVKFREKQREHYGKKGISWEVFSFVTKQNGVLVKSTYVVFLSDAVQDAPTSAALYRLILKQIKLDYPALELLYDKSDNAACYRNWLMLRVRADLSNEFGIRIAETHNNEPQRGKDQADRDIALVKSQLRNFHNAGNDITSANHMKKACDNSSIRGIKSAVVSVVCQKKRVTQSIKPNGVNVTSLHSFRYEKDGVRVWKFFNIGEGMLIPYTSMPALDQSSINVKVETDFSADVCNNVTACAAETASHDGSKPPIWFYCHQPTCYSRFRSSERLEQHLIYEEHNLSTIHPETTGDHIKHLWLNMQENAFHEPAVLVLRAPSGASAYSEPLPYENDCAVGFALKTRKKPNRLNEKQRTYLSKIFSDGQSKKTPKAKPDDVSREMRLAQNNSGMQLFSSNEWLSAPEVMRYFCQLSANVKQNKQASTERREMPPVVEREVAPIADDQESDDEMMEQAEDDYRDEIQQQNEMDFEQFTYDRLLHIINQSASLSESSSSGNENAAIMSEECAKARKKKGQKIEESCSASTRPKRQRTYSSSSSDNDDDLLSNIKQKQKLVISGAATIPETPTTTTSAGKISANSDTGQRKASIVLEQANPVSVYGRVRVLMSSLHDRLNAYQNQRRERKSAKKQQKLFDQENILAYSRSFQYPSISYQAVPGNNKIKEQDLPYINKDSAALVYLNDNRSERRSRFCDRFERQLATESAFAESTEHWTRQMQIAEDEQKHRENSFRRIESCDQREEFLYSTAYLQSTATKAPAPVLKLRPLPVLYENDEEDGQPSHLSQRATKQDAHSSKFENTASMHSAAEKAAEPILKLRPNPELLSASTLRLCHNRDRSLSFSRQNPAPCLPFSHRPERSASFVQHPAPCLPFSHRPERSASFVQHPAPLLPFSHRPERSASFVQNITTSAPILPLRTHHGSKHSLDSGYGSRASFM